MAALSGAQRRDSKGAKTCEVLQTNSTTLYDGSFVALDTTAGTVIPHDDTPGNAFFGLYTGAASTGASGATYVNISTERKILRLQTVTGVSAQTDIGAPVYATTDNDLTLTRPADDAFCIGMVIRWYSSSTCDILVFDPIDSFLYGMAQKGKKTHHLGVYALALGAGSWVNGYKMFGKGKITAFYLVWDGNAASGSSGDVDLTLEINGTAVTGSQISALESGTTTIGTVLATDAAISAANTFYDADTLEVVAAENVAYTAGNVSLFIECEYLL